MLRGVDTSKYQGIINFDALKSAVDFDISRTSVGCPDPGQTVAAYTDPLWARNVAETTRVGLLHGGYHFAYPQVNEPECEAQQFFNAIQENGGLQENCLYALDYEEDSSKNMDEWCAKFINRFKELSGGYTCLLYIDHARATSNDWAQTIATGAGLWLAEWDFNANSPMDPSTPWPFVAFRQYSDKENIAGLSPVDADVFYGDVAAFDRYGYHAGGETTTTTTTAAPEPIPTETTTTSTTQEPTATTTTTEIVEPTTTTTTTQPVISPPMPDPIQPVPDPMPPVVIAIKPGWQTTEFWGTVFVHVLAVLTIVKGLNMTGNKYFDGAIVAAGVIVGLLNQFGYTNSRTQIKVATLNNQLP